MVINSYMSPPVTTNIKKWPPLLVNGHMVDMVNNALVLCDPCGFMHVFMRESATAYYQVIIRT